VTLPARADRVVPGATTAFLFVAPFAASGGLRATCLIVAALALAAAYRPRAGRVPWALIAAFAAWSLLGAASLAWSSVPRHTLEELRAETFYSALAFGVFYLAADAPSNWRRWCVALATGTGAALLASILQQGLGVSLWRHPADGGVGPFTTHLVLIAPLLVALVCHPPWGLRRSTAAVAVGLALLLGAAWVSRDGWTTPSRIVWPALLVVFATAVVAARKAEQFTVSDLRGLKAGLALAVIAAAIAFVAAIAVRSERFYPGDAGIAASVERDLRPRLWWRGIEEWKQAPWLGHGLGREIREAAFLPETPPQASHPLVRHAHNMPLNIALQLGLAGLGLFFAVLWLLAREYWRALHDAAMAPLGVIGLALLAGFLTKNFTDDFLHRHNAQVFWALNGMLVGFASRRPAA
jgi:O-antigen ligase